MCLIVKKGCKIEIAEKDITTYKHVYDDGNYWNGIFYSYPRFLYNEIQKAKYSDQLWLLLDDNDIDTYTELKHLQREKHNDGTIVINEGFQSYVKESNHFLYSKIAICIIPKGSEYCFGEYSDIVSNQIIVFKTKEDYDRYIASKISSN